MTESCRKPESRTMGSFISQEDHYTLGGLLGEGGQGAVHVLLLNGGPCGRAIKTIKIKKGFNKNLSREVCFIYNFYVFFIL